MNSEARVLEKFVAIDELEDPVVVYGTRICPYCIMATRLLAAQKIDYCFVNVASQPSARQWLQEKSSQSTVPQIFIHRRSVGGYQELSELQASGELKVLLQSASPAK